MNIFIVVQIEQKRGKKTLPKSSIWDSNAQTLDLGPSLFAGSTVEIPCSHFCLAEYNPHQEINQSNLKKPDIPFMHLKICLDKYRSEYAWEGRGSDCIWITAPIFCNILIWT